MLSEQPSCFSTKLSQVSQENLDYVIGNLFSDAWVSLITNHEKYKVLNYDETPISQHSTMTFVSYQQTYQNSDTATGGALLKPKVFNFVKKETLAEVFSCEFDEIFKNTFFYRTAPVAASETGF